jgi:putrescine importer
LSLPRLYGVNLSAIRTFYIRSEPGRPSSFFSDAIIPALGFLFCVGIWWNLPAPARIGGGIWLAFGVIYIAVKTLVFREALKPVDFRDG